MQCPLKYRLSRYVIVLCSLLLFALGGCSSGKSNAESPPQKKSAPPRDSTSNVKTPQASGEVTHGADNVLFDASHVSDGYVMLNYSGANEKVKFQITTPDQTTYTYPVSNYGNYSVYPLSGGDGTYTLAVFESASIEDDLYAVAFTQDIEVTVTDEFSPFLYPNCYVNFTEESATVKKGEELAVDCYSDLEVVTNIYNYVIKEITYDIEKAKTVPYGYIPVPDDTLSSGTGICFDYASVMASMLRSQRIPTKLEVGYVEDVYHAWISCYVDEIGWVNDLIEFDGSNWSLMDPTLGANNKRSDVKKYIGEGNKYMVKYTY